VSWGDPGEAAPELGDHHHVFFNTPELAPLTDPNWLRPDGSKNGESGREHLPSTIRWGSFPPLLITSKVPIPQRRLASSHSPFHQLCLSHSSMPRREATAEELLARAKANGYERGAHREKDSIRDANRHVKKTKKNQDCFLYFDEK
jgi:hypothetical protein